MMTKEEVVVSIEAVRLQILNNLQVLSKKVSRGLLDIKGMEDIQDEVDQNITLFGMYAALEIVLEDQSINK